MRGKHAPKRKKSTDSGVAKAVFFDPIGSMDGLLGDAPMGFAVLDHELRYLRVNRALAELSGIPVEDHAGRKLGDIVPEFAELAGPSLLHVLKTGQAIDGVEVSGEFPPGSRNNRFFLVNYHPVRTESEITGVAITVTDVSKLKDAQFSLQNERAEADAVIKRLNFHLENSPVAVTEWDKNFVLTYWSPQAERIFGWKEEEVLGKNPFEFGFVHEGDIRAISDVNSRLSRAVDARSISFNRNYDKSGVVHYCEWYNSALLDEKGEINSIFAIVFDVTDRHRAEEALRAREQFLRLAYEASGMWSWELNPRTGEVRWPEGSSAIYAPIFAGSQATFSEWMKCIHPDDRERVGNEHARVFREAGVFDMHFRVVLPDGSTRWVHNRGSVLRDSEGQPVRMVGIGVDVTARKQAERALAESEEQLRMAFDAAYLAGWDWNIKTGELKWYGNHETMFGLAPGSFDGRYETFVSLVHPDDRQAAVREIRRTIAEKNENYRNEFRLRWADGSDHWILAQGKLYFDDHGEPYRLVGVDVDLTHRKLREESLQSSETRLRLAMQAAKTGCWEWDLKTGKSVWSDELWSLFELEPNSCEPSHANWLAFVHPDDRERVDKRARAAVSKGDDLNLEYRFVTKDGSIRWIAGWAKLLPDESGRPAKMVGIHMDITDRKRSEEALRMNDRLAATGRMAASLAHEINNPLASVTNLLYLLEQRPLDETSKQFVTMASSELGRVAHITKNILGLYRESPVPVQLNVCEILDNVIGFYKPKIDASGVCVRSDYRSLGAVRGFPGELRQVFANLMANALEAMSGTGVINVRVSNCCWNAGGAGVTVTIADSGPGIPTKIKTKVFEPFFTTKGEKGTGLGLWISKEIIRKHGGSIHLRTSASPGQSGTIFRVFLPADSGQRALHASVGD